MKLRFRTITLSIHLVWLSMASCQTETLLPEPEPERGFIVCEETESIKCWQSGSEKVSIFRTQEQYDKKVKNDSSFPGCVGYDKPIFDFDKYTIIYVSRIYTGCEPAQVEQTIEYFGNGIYELHLEVLQQGGCFAEWGYSNICQIPKITNDGEVIVTENVETDWDE